MRILITGATSKIGFAMLQKLGPGNDLVTTVSSDKSLEDFPKNEIQAKSLKIVNCHFNNFDYENDPVLKEAEEGFDAVILNACTKIPEYAMLHEYNIETLYGFVHENIKPNLRILQKVLPKMMEKKFGRIVFVSTMAVEMGLSAYSPYILAKSSLEGLVRNLAVDYGKYNIYSNTLRPGIIKTERTAHLLDNPKYALRAGRVIPAGHVGKPEQIAEAVTMLVSENSYINGQILNVSGGLPLVGSLLKLG